MGSTKNKTKLPNKELIGEIFIFILFPLQNSFTANEIQSYLPIVTIDITIRIPRRISDRTNQQIKGKDSNNIYPRK